MERGKCNVEDCDCEEFELNDDTSCKYCGDPPAKHQAIQAKSGSQAEQATRAHLAQPSQLKQSVVLERWKDIRLGWIPNTLRTSGKFYNELMPQFYQSFWKFYPDHKTFRNAFIMGSTKMRSTIHTLQIPQNLF